MKALTIAGANIRRLLRDTIGLFFLFVFPLVIIVTIGAVFGGGFTARLGIVAPGGGALEAQLVETLAKAQDLKTEGFSDRASLLEAVERGRVEAGLVIPDDYDEALASDAEATVMFIPRPASFASFSIQAKVNAVVADQAALVRAARFALEEAGGSFAEQLAVARAAAERIPTVDVRTRFAQEGVSGSVAGRFDQGAAQQLILFMFLTSLSAAEQLIRTRELGVARRMISTPTSVRTVLAGETLGRFGVAMVQGLFIVVASALLFGVQWGSPLGAGLIVVLFALVGTGAAMLFGALFNNSEQAAAIGVFAGLSLAAVGGCMVPLEVFSPFMRRIAHLTPHAWANDGLFDLVVDRGGLADVAAEIAVLAGFALVLLALATWRLRVAIVRPHSSS